MYSDIRLPFWMQTRPETISHDNIRRLADVGLHRISFGIEHGNEGFRARLLGVGATGLVPAAGTITAPDGRIDEAVGAVVSAGGAAAVVKVASTELATLPAASAERTRK
mgnify:CR=1 FL=1